MRFIRKNGRVIPIADKGETIHSYASDQRKKGLKSSAATGALFGGMFVGMRESASHLLHTRAALHAGDVAGFARHGKLAKFAMVAAGASYVGAIGASVYGAVKEKNARMAEGGPPSFGQGFKTGLKNTGAGVGAFLGVAGGHHLLLSAGAAARPLAQKAGAEIKFRRAKKISGTISNPIRGLLK